MSDTNFTIVDDPARSRFALLEGEQRIGQAAYVEHDGRRIFHHTVVDEAYGGQGLASRLVGAALNETLEAGLVVVPVCPYVKAWLGRHPEIATRTEEPSEADLAALAASA